MSTMTANLPAKQREIWKYSRISPAMLDDYKPFSGAGQRSPGIAKPFAMSDSRRLMFINGVFNPELSTIGDLPAGVELSRMVDAPGKRPIGHVAQDAASPFTLANAEQWQDGVLIKLADGVKLEQPVEIVHINDELAEEQRIAPRNLIVAGKNSSAVILESYLSDPRADQSTSLTMPVTEVICGPGAHIDHLKLINPGYGASYVGSTYVRQAEDSRYFSREFMLGGLQARSELYVDMNGSGALCDIAALYIAGDQQHHDMRTRVNHNAPGCRTRELYKGILDDDARTVFDGQITVARDAQQTEAHQTNRNLLLSDHATAYSIPRLEIYADDVKCSHGATTGQLEDEELFYLRTRGIDAVSARRMLAAAFAAEVLDGIDQPQLRQAMQERITARLTGLQNGRR